VRGVVGVDFVAVEFVLGVPDVCVVEVLLAAEGALPSFLRYLHWTWLAWAQAWI
jgi:hypothetical protein